MAVHAGGPRLFSSIPFTHIGKELKGHGGGKGVNVYLNVTPFVDMMTILVCFLLMVFSASGELISAQRGLQLPSAGQKKGLRKAPIIQVTSDAITFSGKKMGDPIAINDDDTSNEKKIVELYQRLKQEQDAFHASWRDGKVNKTEKNRCNKSFRTNQSPTWRADPINTCIKGLLVLQADKNTTAKVLNRILYTAQQAEYPNVMFAVKLRGGSSGGEH